YAILFEADPELRLLFGKDLGAQSRMLVSMLSSLVKGFNRVAEIEGGVRALGKRHGHYGVNKADYDKLANALLLTLAEFLGDRFTPEIRAAWIAVFGTISELMMRGAKA